MPTYFELRQGAEMAGSVPSVRRPILMPSGLKQLAQSETLEDNETLIEYFDVKIHKVITTTKKQILTIINKYMLSYYRFR